MSKFIIGQRVIYNDSVICIVCKPERKGCIETWVFNPEVNYKHYVSESNLKTLTGGQL